VLGAASVGPYASLTPSRANPSTKVVAIAARDARRAHKFAEKHEIPRVHRSPCVDVTEPRCRRIAFEQSALRQLIVQPNMTE
jgi:hypothetical protein